MLKLLDRQLIRSYLKAYLICFVSLLSLYIVIDLFTNIDDFTSKHSVGVHFLLGDGSVKRLSDNIHINVYKALITRSGNEAMQVP